MRISPPVPKRRSHRPRLLAALALWTAMTTAGGAAAEFSSHVLEVSDVVLARMTLQIGLSGTGEGPIAFDPDGPGALEFDYDPDTQRIVLTRLRLHYTQAWFDILGLDRQSSQDEAGLRQAESQVQALIRRENERDVPSERIVLAGFSQGGALALHTGLRYPERLAGMIGLSTYLPLDETLDTEAHESNRDTPVFMGHGEHDPLVMPEHQCH